MAANFELSTVHKIGIQIKCMVTQVSCPLAQLDNNCRKIVDPYFHINVIELQY